MLKGDIRKRFEEKVIELVDAGIPNWWGHLKDGVQRHMMRCVRIKAVE